MAKFLPLQFGQWVVIQHAQFDLSHESGPYHSTQILLNADTKDFIIRVWGRQVWARAMGIWELQVLSVVTIVEGRVRLPNSARSGKNLAEMT